VGGRYSVPAQKLIDLGMLMQLERFLDRDNFVNAIAPTGDLTKIGRGQFAILFRVADSSKRGLVSWSDFTVFETLLKRPDADYWMAFEYFDVYVHKNCALENFLNPNTACLQRPVRHDHVRRVQERVFGQRWARLDTF
jgi:hypothetical protein